MNKILIPLTMSFAAFLTHAAEPAVMPAKPAIENVRVGDVLPETLLREGAMSVSRGVAYLLSKQAADGSWGGDPAITALCAMGIYQSGNAFDAKKAAESVAKARAYILKHVQPDGSIHVAARRRAYPTYSTAIALTCLATLRHKEDEPAMRAARKFLISLQLDEDNPDMPVKTDDPRYGGVGYGPGKRGASHVDLSNTQWVAEALYASDYLAREGNGGTPADAKEADLAWDKLAQFMTKMQHLPASNRSSWVVSDPKDPSYGGFVYAVESADLPADGGGRRGGKGGRPGEHRGPAPEAVKVDLRTGQRDSLRSYGSMTYAGLKSMIYARVSKDDPRVRAAVAWAAKNYTLDENPGLGSAGLYYYLQTFAKAHGALGSDTVVTASGETRNWRADLVRKLLSAQKGEGEWANTNNRYMEQMPELVTAYSLLSMELALGRSLHD